MKKVLMAGVLALVMALGISAPGVAEEGVTDTEIILGSVQDLSGPLAAWGTQAKNGLEMRAREINEAGGIHGRKIMLVFEDSGYDPKKAVIATNKIITRDKVFAFVGNLGSPTALACLPITTREKIPALFPLAAATGFTQPFNRYCFTVHAPYAEFCRGAVRYFIKEKGVKKVGCLYQDDEFGHDHLRGVKEELAAHNMKLVAEESYKRGATDFSSQIAKLRSGGAELVVLGTVIRETVGALKEAKKIGWNVHMCGSPAAMTKYVPLLSEKAGFSADGFYCASETPYVYADSEIPFVREWFQRHKEWFGTEPDMPTALGYIAMWMFEQGTMKVGRNLTREKLIDTLETIKDLRNPFGTAPYSFSKTSHLGLHQLFMTQVKNGRYVKITDFISFQ
jgi:ABC-type branched-subunit amino acid transport system substrate-binding protein